MHFWPEIARRRRARHDRPHDDLIGLPDPIRMRVVLVRHEGQPIAGATIGVLGDPGIRQFKKRLIGKVDVVLETGEYDMWTSFAGRLAADVIYGVRGARDLLGRWL